MSGTRLHKVPVEPGLAQNSTHAGVDLGAGLGASGDPQALVGVPAAQVTDCLEGSSHSASTGANQQEDPKGDTDSDERPEPSPGVGAD